MTARERRLSICRRAHPQISHTTRGSRQRRSSLGLRSITQSMRRTLEASHTQDQNFAGHSELTVNEGTRPS